MIRSLMICVVAALLLLSVPQANADNLLLTLDLRNTFRDESRGGGTWELFARRVETGKDPQGDGGISSIRALINNIRSDTITFAPGIGQRTTGGPFVNTLPSGTVEILYRQDTDGTAVTSVGVAKKPHLDRLIATGSWPAGPRPNFGDDGATPKPAKSQAKFLGAAQAPYPDSVVAGKTLTAVITLGDLNENGTVTNSDIAPFVARLPGASPSLPYHPAGDINQSGTITAADRALFNSILTGPER